MSMASWAGKGVDMRAHGLIQGWVLLLGWASRVDACPVGQMWEYYRCVPCVAGTYNPTDGFNFCYLCNPGQYNDKIGQTHCMQCPVGTYATRMAQTVCSKCAVDCKTRMTCDPVSGDISATRQCGDTACTPALLQGRQPDYTGDWLTAEYKCRPGEYLRGFTSKEDKDCRRCPSGMVGLDGVKCEWCAGPLEEPYWLDQSSCVCKAGAVMNKTGGCECPDGWRLDGAGRECEPCPENTYGRGGQCYDCAAGNYTSGTGATACAWCETGKYRLQGQKTEGGCKSCANNASYAPLPWSDQCVACNKSCGGLLGWRDAGPCPAASHAQGYRVCTPCELQRPNHSAWISGGGCVYKCDAGYYFSEWDSGACKPCSTAPCPPGFRATPCTEYADRVCNVDCVNASKPTFHSIWAKSTSLASPSGGGEGGSPCPWECEDGYEAVETDYWMFRLHECIPLVA